MDFLLKLYDKECACNDAWFCRSASAAFCWWGRGGVFHGSCLMFFGVCSIVVVFFDLEGVFH